MFKSLRSVEENKINHSGRSHVGETMQIEGDLHSAGAVDVAGLINGSVNVAEVMVFETGSIKGNLKVNKIEINGHVEGQVIADVIILGKNAVIKGDLLFRVSLKTIEGYIKRVESNEKIVDREEEDQDIQDIMPVQRPELGRPTLVKESLLTKQEKKVI